MQRLTSFSLRHPRIALLGIALVTAVMVPGLLQLRSDASYRALLGADHPAVERLDRFLEEFGGGLPILVLWSCDPEDPCAHALDDTSLAMASRLSAELEALSGVSSVRGPATTPLLVPSEDGFAVRYLEEGEETPPDLDALRASASRDPLWLGSILSEDGRVGAIVMSLESTESEMNARVVTGLLAALEPHEAAGFRFRLMGHPVLIQLTETDLDADAMRIVPAIVLVIALVTWFFCRSARATFAAIGTLLVSVAWTFGLLGWLGWPRTAVMQALAPCLLVIGVCNALHVLARYASERAGSGAGSDGRRLLETVSGDIGRACLLSTATTAGALFSFATSGAETFVRFGVSAGIGILLGLLLTFTLFPILLARVTDVSEGESRTSLGWSRALERSVRWTHRRWPLVLAFAAVLSVLGAVGMGRLEVETSVRRTYGERSRVVAWLEFMNDRLRGSETLEIRLGVPATARVEDPETLRTLGELRSFLAGVEGLGRSWSLLDLLERANAALHGDDRAWARPGDTAQANAELLLLLSLAGADVLSPWLAPDRRALRVSVESTAQGQSEYRRISESLDVWTSAHLGEGWTLERSGPLSVAQATFDDVQRTQTGSFLTAAATVFCLIAIFFRSLRAAFMALVPATIPVLTVLGAMGFLGIPLDMGTALVSAVVLGIADDDAIHLLSQFEVRRRAGVSAVQAMLDALLHVGRGVITTSLALAIGFSAFVISSWESVRNFGVLSALAILGAAVAVLFVLPALLFGLDALRARRFGKSLPFEGVAQPEGRGK